jgi:hypothetical protein
VEAAVVAGRKEDSWMRLGERPPGIGGSQGKKTRKGHDLCWWRWESKSALLVVVVAEVGGTKMMMLMAGVTCRGWEVAFGGSFAKVSPDINCLGNKEPHRYIRICLREFVTRSLSIFEMRHPSYQIHKLCETKDQIRWKSHVEYR